MKKEKILRIIFVILLALAIRIYIEITPSLQDKTTPRLSQSVQISELDICGIHYSVEGVPETVDVCGMIEIKDGANAAHLNILVFWMPEKIPVSTLSTQELDLFENGSFSRNLVINGEGDYLVEVWKGRTVLDSLEFTATQEK